ncbi:MAG: protein adenylyltransferase SelO family protein, partial [Alloalcanivorax venustensis]|uniref:protein adenylyltransferase SelO family protein n=1 Tax=Alloalcanivorax venustensis TaxID=172371 RepID=UPI0032969BF8
MSPRMSANPFGFRFDNSYARLPETLFSFCDPQPVQAPELLLFNGELAAQLGLDAEALNSDTGAALLGGNQPLPGGEPLAQAYAGHQFGNPTMLGDGRAVLLGEQLTPDDQRRDIQLKGSGRTPFSRGGDGRAALGPMLREYIISEAMHALGVPTTRALAVVGTGEQVLRDTAQPGAILTRVAAPHLRVGTFQYAAGRQDKALLETLVDYTLKRHYPDRVG